MNRQKNLETILVLVLAFIAGYWFLRNRLDDRAPYLLYAALVIGLAGLFIPWLAAQIHWAWMKLAEGIGWVMSKLILTTVFFVILLPVAGLSRLFGKKSAMRNRQQDSYYISRNHRFEKKNLEQVW